MSVWVGFLSSITGYVFMCDHVYGCLQMTTNIFKMLSSLLYLVFGLASFDNIPPVFVTCLKCI